ncbi:uncharacterized protein LOC124911109 [Impatiens glandulifera]|uniref:uncharacterized protein LOC124911109 n=1 Tax=Impatiens glandulifera TaxID=253017 RepID=UPI001FB11420|nr:uncharacterized protein LOC124911109 [Impatiens glandulifera]
MVMNIVVHLIKDEKIIVERIRCLLSKTKLPQRFGVKHYTRWCFVHITQGDKSKFDVKSYECIFLGYVQDELGYKLYDLVEKKLVRSSEVIFFEDETNGKSDKAKDNELKKKENRVKEDDVEGEHDVHLDDL